MAKGASSRLLAELEKLRVSLDRMDGRINTVLAQLSALEARLIEADGTRDQARSRDSSKRLH